ncbi:HAD family hydrolase [Alkalicoccus urumqiensis]|uniref:Phosphoserine phosphatase n=1 Tax=Alkalicoccus urumqiensis TaxID=1548213 RepID=A0A2P6MGC0_ALKUR|nr:HAD family hydrolase [Alkalicoccus urumqiensis]PRO65342.1 haloacid dehalogenase [Alkalicoccus urumqiensis]
MTSVFFDLDDTILWDAKSIQTALNRTCSDAAGTYGLDADELENEVRRTARKRYSEYEVYDFTQMIGINPFEGLWGTFDDPAFDFPEMNRMIRGYQRTVWQEALSSFGTILSDAEAEQLAQQFIKYRIQSPFVFEDAYPVLSELKQSCTLVLLTNGAPSLQNLKLDITKEIAPYFDHVIISGDFGRGKPDVSLFEYALEKSGSHPEDTWMIGDNPKTDILGAGRAGIRSVWLNRFDDPPHADIKADHEIRSLHELPELIRQGK